MPTLLWCAGRLSEHALSAASRLAPTRVIGVDGGADSARAAGLKVDLVVGDLDSVDRSAWTDELIESLDGQNDSDLVKALTLCADRGWRDIFIVGVEGGRVDHALGAWAALAEAPLELAIRMFIDAAVAHRATLIQSVEVNLGEDARFSVFGLTGTDGRAAPRVGLTGARWSLTDTPLPLSTRGLSNRATGGPVRLTTDGVAVLIVPAL